MICQNEQVLPNVYRMDKRIKKLGSRRAEESCWRDSFCVHFLLTHGIMVAAWGNETGERYEIKYVDDSKPSAGTGTGGVFKRQ